MRKLLAIILAVMTMTSVACAAPEYGEHATVATVDYDELYWGQGISYTRVIELQHSGEHNGTLVATYEMYTSGLRVEKPGYNIHVSHDGGSTWEMVATVREKRRRSSRSSSLSCMSCRARLVTCLPARCCWPPAPSTLVMAGSRLSACTAATTSEKLGTVWYGGCGWRFGNRRVGTLPDGAARRPSGLLLL